MAEVLAVLGAAPAESSAVTIASPDIAENGAVVPIAVTSTIPKTEAIYILVEKNPFPMTAAFMIPEGTEPYVATRAKMGESTKVFAVVKADGQALPGLARNQGHARRLRRLTPSSSSTRNSDG